MSRCCPVCGAALDGLRGDATYCGAACRAEASRRRRLESGPVDDPRHRATLGAPNRRTNRVAGVQARGRLQLTERIEAVLASAGTNPRSGLPESFTHRELGEIAYGTAELTATQLSAVRRSVARLVAGGWAERGRRRYPGQVEIHRPLTPAECEIQVEATRPLIDRMEARRSATPYPVDAGHEGVVEVPVEPMLKINADGVELREVGL